MDIHEPNPTRMWLMPLFNAFAFCTAAMTRPSKTGVAASAPLSISSPILSFCPAAKRSASLPDTPCLAFDAAPVPASDDNCVMSALSWAHRVVSSKYVDSARCIFLVRRSAKSFWGESLDLTTII